MKKDAIKVSNEKGHEVNRLCNISKVAKSSYYHYLSHNVIEEKDKVIVEALMKLPKEQLMKGTKDKVISLKGMGIEISYKHLWRICNKYGFLSEVRQKRYPKDYYAKHKEELKETVADNILNREFNCDKPLTKLCTDITYVKVKGGWLFLSVIIDLCTREIVSYCVSKTINTKLTIDTVKKLKMKYPDIDGCYILIKEVPIQVRSSMSL
ncbi:MAG: DDE-type integrase/transposase/recombinase [Treponema sp.]